jgi:hypothetical protein
MCKADFIASKNEAGWLSWRQEGGHRWCKLFGAWWDGT